MPPAVPFLSTRPLNAASRHTVPSDLAHLRPSTGLEMTDRVFGLFRLRPLVLLGLGALGGLMSLESQLVQQREGTVYAMAGLALGMGAKWPLAAAVTAAFQTLLFPRRPLGAWAALRGVAGRLPHLLLTLLLSDAVLALMALTAVDLLQAPRGGLTLDPFSWALASTMGVLALYLAALWSLVPAVVLLEGRMLFDALGRSAELMRRRFSGRLFGDSAVRRLVLLLALPFTVVVAAQLTLPAVWWLAAGMPRLTLTGPSVIPAGVPVWESAGLAVGALLSALLWPFVQAAVAVLYAECRMRREGLDLQTRLLAREVSGHPDCLPPPA